ncbi:MAG: PTS sugar transporter subunit IIC [Tissierellia bacterium]|nr:PTS sugar transporter subunit IIC [Tissierellia bacterium]
MSQVKTFLKKKGIMLDWRVYVLDVLSNMALGLFSTLLIGTILNSIGQKLHIPFLSEVLWPMARDMTGPAIAVAIALSLKAPKLIILASTVVGMAGNVDGGPVGALVATVLAVEIAKLVSGETKIDLIVTPAVTIIVGLLVATTIGPPINGFMIALGQMVMYATTLQPFLMGIIVAVVVGMVLTLPISSAALCMMLSLSGLAGGAATAGCCAQMIGFAVISWSDNGLSGLLSQGLGTSMLQVPNIVKNWKIWIPPTLASVITGPLSTMVFKMENIPIGSGMGTSGLVGQIGTLTAMEQFPQTHVWTGIILLHFILPAVLSYVFYRILKNIGWIKDGDMKIQGL